MEVFVNMAWRVFLFICCFVISTEILAQDKIEKEESIKERKVPQMATEWLYDTFEKIRKPKWYKEFSEVGYSFEAKFRYKNGFHSVEFDSLGLVQDVEIEIKLKRLSKEIQSQILTYLNENHRVFKVNKLQIQYSGVPDALEDYFDDEVKEGILINHEMEFSGTDLSGDSRIWEVTFDQNGLFLGKRVVIVRGMDNIIF
jgi:hypothetical protein